MPLSSAPCDETLRAWRNRFDFRTLCRLAGCRPVVMRDGDTLCRARHGVATRAFGSALRAPAIHGIPCKETAMPDPKRISPVRSPCLSPVPRGAGADRSTSGSRGGRPGALAPFRRVFSGTHPPAAQATARPATPVAPLARGHRAPLRPRPGAGLGSDHRRGRGLHPCRRHHRCKHRHGHRRLFGGKRRGHSDPAVGSTQTLTAVNNNTNGPTGLPVITSELTIEGNDRVFSNMV